MAAAIEKATGTVPTLIEGRGGVFDVMADGQVIFSKRVSGRFPMPEEILKLVR